MTTRSRATAAGLAGLCLALALALSLALSLAGPALAQTPPTEQEAPEAPMTATVSANGTFDVKLAPQTPSEAEDATLGRLAIAKQFHGDLEGTSTGTMLAVQTAVEGSAGYVALERVSGTLHGRTGTFVLQHSGTMDRGAPQLSITVVPDSGTDQLAGIAGTMTIEITDGKHFYSFAYTLATAP